MALHKYRVGQILFHRPPEAPNPAASKGYKVLRLLGSDLGEKLYRIKSITEINPRIAREGDLAVFLPQ
jgi:hypothetical protein